MRTKEKLASMAVALAASLLLLPSATLAKGRERLHGQNVIALVSPAKGTSAAGTYASRAGNHANHLEYVFDGLAAVSNDLFSYLNSDDARSHYYTAYKPILEQAKRGEGIFAAIEQLGDALRVLESTWILDTQQDVEAISAAIQQVINEGDRFIVVQMVPGNRQGWLAKSMWQWMRLHEHPATNT